MTWKVVSPMPLVRFSLPSRTRSARSSGSMSAMTPAAFRNAWTLKVGAAPRSNQNAISFSASTASIQPLPLAFPVPHVSLCPLPSLFLLQRRSVLVQLDVVAAAVIKHGGNAGGVLRGFALEADAGGGEAVMFGPDVGDPKDDGREARFVQSVHVGGRDRVVTRLQQQPHVAPGGAIVLRTGALGA